MTKQFRVPFEVTFRGVSVVLGTDAAAAKRIVSGMPIRSLWEMGAPAEIVTRDPVEVFPA